jgi:RimJ/RimL family protein N-acetyltransferase
MLVLGPGVREWVSRQTGHEYPGNATAIGYERHGQIVQGVVFSDYSGANIQGHLACAPGRSFFPTFVAAMVDYPFNQLGCRRITILVATQNLKSQRIVEHLGAVREGVMTDALDDDDLIVYGLLRRNAQYWLTARFSDKLKKYRSEHE